MPVADEALSADDLIKQQATRDSLRWFRELAERDRLDHTPAPLGYGTVRRVQTVLDRLLAENRQLRDGFAKQTLNSGGES